MKSLYTTSLAFILLLTSLSGQETPKSKDKESNGLSVSLDLGGLTVKPALALSLKNRKSGFRIQPRVSYHITEILYTELTFGYEHIEDYEVSSDFRDYTLKGYFVKPGVGFSYLEDKLFIGIGMFLTSQSESGTVTIGGEYFNPFESEKSRDINVLGAYFKLGSNYPITPKISLGIELNYMYGRIVSDYTLQESEQEIEAIAGGGYNILGNSKQWSMSFPGFIYMKYKF